METAGRLAEHVTLQQGFRAHGPDPCAGSDVAGGSAAHKDQARTVHDVGSLRGNAVSNALVSKANSTNSTAAWLWRQLDLAGLGDVLDSCRCDPTPTE